MRDSPFTAILISLFAEWAWGVVVGVLFHRMTFLRRGGGFYVEGDEYRIAFFSLIITSSLIVFRTLEMWAMTGEFVIENYWRWIGSVLFAWGLKVGFRKAQQAVALRGTAAVLPPITEIPDE